MENAPHKSESDSETDSDEAEGRPIFKLFKFEAPDKEEPSPEPPKLPPLELVKPEKSEHSWLSNAESEDEDEDVSKAAEIPKQASKELPADATLEDHVEAVAAETPEATEAEAPTEQLGEAEARVIEPELVAINRELEGDEPVDEDIEKFRDLIVVEGKDSETAYQEVMAELGVDEGAENEDDLFNLGLEEADAEQLDELALEEDETVLELNHDQEQQPALAFETDHEADPDDEANAAGTTGAATTAATAGAAAATASRPTSAAGGGGVFGGGMPPHGGPGGFGPSGGPGGPGAGGPGGGFNSAPTAPSPATPNQLSQQHERDRPHPAAMALFGGVIGYLVGRRRGRIKAEKRLLPVQKKLEKQVTDLQSQLQEKEDRIRKAAAAKTKRETVVVQAPMEGQPKAEQITIETKTETPSAAAPNEKPRTVIERQRAPEAHQLHGSEKASEHIGQVLIAAETPAALVGRHEKITKKLERAKQEDLRKATEKAPELHVQKRAETMSRAELLSFSEKIVVDGSSLRQIYETHLIGERGLRRLVAEHLRGGDIKRALKQEVVEREIDFERDPAMRDIAKPGAATGGGTANGGPEVLNHMIEKAAANVGGSSEEMAYYKARTNFEAEQHKQQLKKQRVIDISIVGVISLLIVVIAILFVTRAG